jgi:hypothetical protein
MRPLSRMLTVAVGGLALVSVCGCAGKKGNPYHHSFWFGPAAAQPPPLASATELDFAKHWHDHNHE